MRKHIHSFAFVLCVFSDFWTFKSQKCQTSIQKIQLQIWSKWIYIAAPPLLSITRINLTKTIAQSPLWNKWWSSNLAEGWLSLPKKCVFWVNTTKKRGTVNWAIFGLLMVLDFLSYRWRSHQTIILNNYAKEENLQVPLPSYCTTVSNQFVWKQGGRKCMNLGFWFIDHRITSIARPKTYAGLSRSSLYRHSRFFSIEFTSLLPCDHWRCRYFLLWRRIKKVCQNCR